MELLQPSCHLVKVLFPLKQQSSLLTANEVKKKDIIRNCIINVFSTVNIDLLKINLMFLMFPNLKMEKKTTIY